MPVGDDKEKKKESELLEFSTEADRNKDKELHDDDMDFDDFAKTIDERIDLLFRPSDEISEIGSDIGEGDLAAEGKTVSESEAIEVSADKAVATDTPEYGTIKSDLNLEILQKRPAEETKEDKVSADSVTNLLEKVHIAYLDLDWEFSKENVQNLQRSLQELKGVVDLSEEADSLFHIVESILDLFYKDESAVSYGSMSILREALNLLLKVLQKPAGPDEKALLAGITKRFNKLVGISVKGMVEKGEPIAVRKVKEPEKPEKEEVAVEVGKKEVFTSETEVGVARYDTIEDEKPLVAEKLEITEKPVAKEYVAKDIHDVISEIERVHSLLQQISLAIERENKLFAKIINVFSQRPKLKQIADYLVKIEHNYSKYSNQLKALETSIVGSIEALRRLSIEPTIGATEIKRDQPEIADTAEEAPTEVDVAEEIPDEIRELIVVQIHGQNVALPFENVIRVANVASKKIQSILGRGHAKLKDVKPFLRGIKYGVLGRWRAMPSGFLKSIEFPLIDISDLGEEFKGADNIFYEGIVFIGEDKKYGALPVDAIFSTTPEILKEYSPVKNKKGILGIGVSESEKEFKILNVSEILK